VFPAKLVLAASLLLPAAASAQSAPALLESYSRATTLLNFMTTYVGEVLLGCAEKKVVTEEQAEERFASYRKRNAALLERAETWSQEAEARLRAQGGEREARRNADKAGLGAVAEASTRAAGEIGKAGDARAYCAARLAAIESGSYDLSTNAELMNLLKVKP
jgi:hypothetical protein